MRTVAVTGSGSGIGAAVRARLERAGVHVLGVDLRGAEVTADLATPAGRAAAVDGVRRASAGRLDGLVACAGVGPHVEDHPALVSIDYFGAQKVLDACRELLSRGDAPAAVAVSSNASSLPGVDSALLDACLAGDEPEARRLAAALDGHACYATAKRGLALWVRRHAPAWAEAGVRLNAVAPGAVATPLLQGGLDHPIYGDAIRGFPIPIGGFGAPDDVAAVIAFLLGPEARFVCGSVVFCDGGTDALLRAEAY